MYQRENVIGPIATLLEYARELERACLELQDQASPAWSHAAEFIDVQAPTYRRDLEQAVLPLLKSRVPAEDEESDLSRTLILVAAELAELDTRWHELKPALERESAAVLGERITAYAELWEQHVDRLENHIIPALHAVLRERDMTLLGAALARHQGVLWSADDTPDATS